MAKKASPVKKEENKAKRVKVTGFVPMKLKDYTISQKSSGRYEVVNSKGANVNGADKVKILLEAKLLKPSLPKAASAAPSEPTADATV